MRVLIMGSNARTGSTRYSDRYVTFAGMLRAAHRAAGDDVFIRNWEPGIQHEGWGRIYLGLSSPAYIGSDRIFGTLIALAELRDGPGHDPRLRFFVDDPDLRVLRNSIVSVAKEPSRILAPFNAKRQDYDLVTQDESFRAKVERGITLLNVEDLNWPQTYVPAFPWADRDRITRALWPSQRANVTLVDPTAFVPAADLLEAAAKKPAPRSISPMGPHWQAEAPNNDPWVKTVHVRAPIIGSRVGNDGARISVYQRALGVLEPQLSPDGPGWWSSRMVLAALARTYYATDWRGLMEMAHHTPYIQYLPPAYEELNSLEQGILADAQHSALTASTWTAEQAWEALDVAV
jgi:hypothetical protein